MIELFFSPLLIPEQISAICSKGDAFYKDACVILQNFANAPAVTDAKSRELQLPACEIYNIPYSFSSSLRLSITPLSAIESDERAPTMMWSTSVTPMSESARIASRVKATSSLEGEG